MCRSQDRVPQEGWKYSDPRGRAPGFQLPPDWYYCAGHVDFLLRLYLSFSYLLGCGFVLISLNVVVTLPGLRCFFRRNCSICSCKFLVSMGGGEFRIFFLCHLETEHPVLFFESAEFSRRYSRKTSFQSDDRHLCNSNTLLAPPPQPVGCPIIHPQDFCVLLAMMGYTPVTVDSLLA